MTMMRSKYGARKCTLHTPAHASLKECRRYGQLVLLERAGAIRNLQQQVVYELAPGVVIDGRKRPPIRYVADFEYEERTDGVRGTMAEGEVFWPTIIEDCKGVETPMFRLKRHLLAVQGYTVRLT